VRGAGITAALALLLIGSPVRSQVLHRTEPGETLGDLAKRYYGDPSLADLIAAHNGLGTKLQPGVELRLPGASRHTVVPGESWDDLAARYWSDARLGPTLASWFGDTSDPQVGANLEVPALFGYRLAAGETLVGLARRFYRDITRADLLARLNRVDDPKHLHAGRKLQIPVVAWLEEMDGAASRVASRGPEPAPSASSSSHDVAAAPSRSDPDLARDLMRAVNAYLDGDFEGALSQFENQRKRVLTRGTEDQRKLLLRYLIFSYVAFDRDDATCQTYAALRQLERPPRLEPELVSPKIRDALGRCD
jgi:LysM repeat protein